MPHDLIHMFPTINDTDMNFLCSPPDENEITYALWSIQPYKAPGEDGIHVVFYQKNWDHTKYHIINAIKNIFFNLANRR